MTFWNVGRKAVVATKCIDHLIGLAATDQCCVVVSRPASDLHVARISLYNASGRLISSRCIDMQEHPTTTISTSHVVLASQSRVYTWDYSEMLAVEHAHRYSVVQRRPSVAGTDERWLHAAPTTRDDADPIACAALRGSALVLVHTSGAAEWHQLEPESSRGNGPIEQNFSLSHCRSPPSCVSLNSDATTLAVLERNGTLTLVDIKAAAAAGGAAAGGGEAATAATSGGGGGGGGVAPGGKVLGFERSNVWMMRWAEDDPEYLAVMEQRKRYIFRGVDPEEPQDSSSYISAFRNMEVESVDLDAIFCDRANNGRAAAPNTSVLLSSCTESSEIKALRDTRALLTSGGGDDGFADTVRWVRENAHPRQWRLLADAALDLLDLDAADEAFAQLNDFDGLRLVRTLRDAEGADRRRAIVEEHRAGGPVAVVGGDPDADLFDRSLCFPVRVGTGADRDDADTDTDTDEDDVGGGAGVAYSAGNAGSGAALRHGDAHRVRCGFRGVGANIDVAAVRLPALPHPQQAPHRKPDRLGPRGIRREDGPLEEMYLRAGVLRVSRVQQRF